MSEVTDQSEVLKHKKSAHDYYATAVQVLTTRVQFYFEEFEGIHQVVGFLNGIKAQILKEIELVEPPKPKAKPEAYHMDLSHVKGEEAHLGQ